MLGFLGLWGHWVQLTVEPYDKAAMKACETGIEQSDTGATISVDSECVISNQDVCF